MATKSVKLRAFKVEKKSVVKSNSELRHTLSAKLNGSHAKDRRMKINIELTDNNKINEPQLQNSMEEFLRELINERIY